MSFLNRAVGSASPEERLERENQIFVGCRSPESADETIELGLRQTLPEILKPYNLESHFASHIPLLEATSLEKICRDIALTQGSIIDLTDASPNIYLELGIAIGANKPVLTLLSGESASSLLKGFGTLTYHGYQHLKNVLEENVPEWLDEIGVHPRSSDYCYFTRRSCRLESRPSASLTSKCYLFIDQDMDYTVDLRNALNEILRESDYTPCELSIEVLFSFCRHCKALHDSAFVVANCCKETPLDAYLLLGLAIGSEIPPFPMVHKGFHLPRLMQLDPFKYEKADWIDEGRKQELSQKLKRFLERLEESSQYRMPRVKTIVSNLLQTAFRKEELETFSRHNFPEVRKKKQTLAIALTDHCMSESRLPELLGRVQQYNPDRYAEFESQLRDARLLETQPEKFVGKQLRLRIRETDRWPVSKRATLSTLAGGMLQIPFEAIRELDERPEDYLLMLEMPERAADHLFFDFEMDYLEEHTAIRERRLIKKVWLLGHSDEALSRMRSLLSEDFEVVKETKSVEETISQSERLYKEGYRCLDGLIWDIDSTDITQPQELLKSCRILWRECSFILFGDDPPRELIKKVLGELVDRICILIREQIHNQAEEVFDTVFKPRGEEEVEDGGKYWLLSAKIGERDFGKYVLPKNVFVSFLEERPPASTPSSGEVLFCGELVLDTGAYEVTKRGESLELTPKEFQLLELFMRNPGRTLKREEIVRELWETEYDEDTQMLTTHISNLRGKIEDNPRNPVYIKTVRRVGYVLKC